MPELPEVETVVRSLRPHIEGRTIAHAEFRSKFVTPGDRDSLAAKLTNLQIASLTRRGKFIWVRTTAAPSLAIHLGMTGRLLVGPGEGPHTHGIFDFTDGTRLRYDDVRQFGRIEYSASGIPWRIEQLGPEPLDIAASLFVGRLRARGAQIKPLLLDQSFLAGLGNIYVDEALFRARIDPRVAASSVSKPRALALHQAIVELLQLAIAYRGSSISDYVDAEGEAGSFQHLHQVYGKEGKPCPNCGKPIVRIIVAQRGTHLCPACQRGSRAHPLANAASPTPGNSST